MNRRQSFKLLAGVATVGSTVLATGRAALAQSPADGPFKVPPLGYAYDALEPHIDKATMEFHHKNHHGAYVATLNSTVPKWPELATRKPVEILANLSSVPEAVRTPVRNGLGGHWNHSFFWELMTPGGSTAPQGDLKAAIDGTFGSFDKMRELVTQAGTGRFGSGWAWLAVDKDKKLAIFNTPYQDTPHMEMAARGAVVGTDVWEHAYYLRYQYRRADYLKAWWNTVNWDKATANFKAATA
jgi:Fe-Mn family superoxide dismutase